jgi:hypothetical protein
MTAHISQIANMPLTIATRERHPTMDKGNCMLKRLFLIVPLVLSASSSAFAQTGNASLGGIVQDPSKALVPGVSITATNIDTGVVTPTLTNEAGAYNFPVLQPGNYRVSAELQGFKKAANEVRLGYAVQIRVDFTLEIGTTTQTVDVSTSADAALRESSASIGDVLSQQRVMELPIVGNNVLDLLNTLPGLRPSVAGEYLNTINGLSLDTINTTRDGLSINDGRVSATNTGFTAGYKVFSNTTLVPDLVGEIRLILTPVDAEMGRGNSQIQISTRSGTNRYGGSAAWYVRNTALDPNTWTNNHTLQADGTPVPPNWNNNHQYTISYGGPIKIPGLYDGKNKTFFYGLFEQNIHNTRETQTVNVLTDTARQGIYRYWTGYNPVGFNPNATIASPTFPLTATTASYISVDLNGNPVAPPADPSSLTAIPGQPGFVPYSGRLVCFSVFGTQRMDDNFGMVPFTAADCPGGTISTPSTGTTWDRFRPVADTTGYMRKILSLTPRANYFGGGDGLNIGQFRYLRGRNGSNSQQSVVGADLYSNNKQFNIKVDHNFNARHKVAVSYSHQEDDSADSVAQYPGGINGTLTRGPHLVTVNFTSTLSSNMVNEARFGSNHTSTFGNPAWFSPDPEIRKSAEAILMTGGPSVQNPSYNYLTVVNNGCCSVLGPAFGNILNSNGYMATNGVNITQYINDLYNFADTLSWSRGKHAFKFGGELRLPRSNGNGSVQPYPTITIGNNTSATTTVSPFGNVANFATELPGFLNAAPAGVTAARTSTTNLLYWMNGSVNNAAAQYWIDDFTDVQDGRWEDTSTKDSRFRNEIFKEWAFFVKDDFKMTRRLTLNLGVRWEYIASPYVDSGMTVAVNDYAYGLFGAARTAQQSSEQFAADPFAIFLKSGGLYLNGYGSSPANPLACETGGQQLPQLPVSTCDASMLTSISFVGPKSPNPDRLAIPVSYYDIGPAVGFSYQLPWFGEGKTVIRGGYSQTYGGAGRNTGTLGTEGVIANVPGSTATPTTVVGDAAFQAILASRALNLSDLPTLVPVKPTSLPGRALPLYGRLNTPLPTTTYDPNHVTPYTQNLTLSVTRQVSRNLTVDVRWTGTLGRKLDGSLNTNVANVYHNPEFYQALVDARAGKDPVLLDQLLAGLNLNSNVTGAGGTGTFGNVGTVNSVGVYQSGAAHMRRSATFAADLANGDFLAVSNSLLALNPTGLQNLPASLASAGVGMRTIRNGCDRIANGFNYVQQTSTTTFAPGFNASNATPLRCFPEDYLTSNPQFQTVAYNANLGHSNYNALQVQMTLRPTHGLSVQGTWIYAGSMQLPGAPLNGFADPSDRNLDFAKGPESTHTLRMNGTFELPIGPNKTFFANTSGWVGRLIEHWQTGFIFNGGTGQPATVFGATNHLYGSSRYDVVDPAFDPRGGNVVWNGPNNNTGTYFGSPSPYIGVADPQCTDNSVTANTDRMGTNLAASCNLQALAQRNPDGTVGQLQLAYPQPGRVGNYGLRKIKYYGLWSFDANISKVFRLTESKQLQVRIDATNVLNHPVPNLPSFTPNTFGQINGKGNQTRSLQGQLRLNF